MGGVPLALNGKVKDLHLCHCHATNHLRATLIVNSDHNEADRAALKWSIKWLRIAFG